MKKSFKILIPSLMVAYFLAGNIALSNSDATASRNNAINYSQIETLKEQMKVMRGEIEQLQFDNARLNDKIVKFSADIEFRFNQYDASKAAPKPDNKALDNIDTGLDNNIILSKNDASKLDKSLADNSISNQDISKDPVLVKSIKDKNAEQEFQDAYSMIKSRDYKNAREAFIKFTNSYPNNLLIGSARYWIGETFFVEEDYEKAAIEYLKGYQANIRGSKAPENLLKLAKSLAKFDKRKVEACITLAKLGAEFPNAQNVIKKQALDDMKNLRCNVLLNKQ